MMPRPRHAKRTLIPVWLQQRTVPAWLLYVVAGVLALVWSVASYMVVAPQAQQNLPTHGVVWGFLAAFLVSFAGAAAITGGAYLLDRKTREA